jgi:hypothetical protein
MRIRILFVLLTIAVSASAQQWTRSDSIRLDRLMNGDGELELSNRMPLQIDFGGGIMGSPMQPTEKSWMSADETLPSAIDGQEPLDMRAVLTLHPYKPNTPYNYDPVRGRTFKVGRDTWRSNPYYALTSLRRYTNSTEPYRKVTPSGHDFSTVFTRDFWDRKGRLRRARTLLVLSQYGDSTTVALNKPILGITQ